METSNEPEQNPRSRKHTRYLMVPLRVHDPTRVRTILCKYLSTEIGFGLSLKGGRLVGFTKRGEYSTTALLRRAAEWLRVSYSTLYRLTRGTAGHISWATAFAVEKRLLDRDPEFWAVLKPALIGPRTRRILASYVGAVEQAIQWDRKMGSATWNYWFVDEAEKKELHKLDALIKRLGLPATRWDLARRRAVAPILAWPKLRKHSWDKRPKLLKLGIRFECALVREEVRVLRELLQAAG